jgi:hypothetical protein
MFIYRKKGDILEKTERRQEWPCKKEKRCKENLPR